MNYSDKSYERLPVCGQEAFKRNWTLLTSRLRNANINHFAVPNNRFYKIGILQQNQGQLKSVLNTLALRKGIVVEYQLRHTWYIFIPFVSPGSYFGHTPRYRVYYKYRSFGIELYGPEVACILELWRQYDDRIECYYSNSVASRLPSNETWSICPIDSITKQSRLIAEKKTALEINFPIDVVYTWVDGMDPEWRKKRNFIRTKESGEIPRHPSAVHEARCRNHEELKYSLRSLCMYGDFFRRVYIVTSDQTPNWLNVNHPDIELISDRQILRDGGSLPTFNSHAIESRLHRIEGLAEHFLYLNDDFFLARHMTPERFFTPHGQAAVFSSPHNVPTRVSDIIDRPIDTANQNSQTLIETRFGRYPTHKPQHAPYALIRSVLLEMESIYHSEFEAVASSRFRSKNDIAVATSLFAYHSLCTGIAIPSSFKSRYIDINDPLFPLLISPFSRLLRNKYDSFCLNEVDNGRMPSSIRDRLVPWFLAWRFPMPSPFELD